MAGNTDGPEQTGRQLGAQLRQWLATDHATDRVTDRITDPVSDLNPQWLANRWSDALGSDESLKAPLRDLAARPLFRQCLRQQGLARRTSLEQLGRELAATYSPGVLAQLLDLLEEFGQINLPRDGLPPANAPRRRQVRWLPLGRRLRPLAGGIALAAAAALVWMWSGAELDRLLFEDWGWSGGAVLVLVLALIEALLLAPPLRHWRRDALLASDLAGDSRHAWRWLSAAWVQPRRGEAALNLIVLAVILGNSALQLPDVILRYALTSLATLIAVALVQPAAAPPRCWGGASGAVGALIGLAGSLSLLQRRDLGYTVNPLTIPAWVLLLIYAGLQLSWQSRERHQAAASGVSADRWGELLASPWCWGLLFGAGWGLVSWLLQLLHSLQSAAQA